MHRVWPPSSISNERRIPCAPWSSAGLLSSSRRAVDVRFRDQTRDRTGRRSTFRFVPARGARVQVHILFTCFFYDLVALRQPRASNGLRLKLKGDGRDVDETDVQSTHSTGSADGRRGVRRLTESTRPLSESLYSEPMYDRTRRKRSQNTWPSIKNHTDCHADYCRSFHVLDAANPSNALACSLAAADSNLSFHP